MALFSYIVRSDSGFSPNPYHGICTLACCKPGIRRSAMVGDWVAGLTSKGSGYDLIYAMKVGEALPIADYWRDTRFRKKRPDFETEIGSLGDSIYEPLDDTNNFRQLRSRHSATDPAFKTGDARRYTEAENERSKSRDLSVKRVLIATEFVYFGTEKAQKLPDDLREAMSVGRGYRSRFSSKILHKWEAYMSTLPRGLLNSLLPENGWKRECNDCGCSRPKNAKNTRKSRPCV